MATARNPITGDTLRSKRNNKNFEDNYEKVFKKGSAVEKGSWVQDPVTGKLVKKTQ